MKNKNYFCPICGHIMKYDIYEENIGVVESYFYCNTCHYGEEYAYGNYKEYIGHYCFIWSYLDENKKYFQNFWKKRNKNLYNMKRNWKKHKKKTKAIITIFPNFKLPYIF